MASRVCAGVGSAGVDGEGVLHALHRAAVGMNMGVKDRLFSRAFLFSGAFDEFLDRVGALEVGCLELLDAPALLLVKTLSHKFGHLLELAL